MPLSVNITLCNKHLNGILCNQYNSIEPSVFTVNEQYYYASPIKGIKY